MKKTKLISEGSCKDLMRIIIKIDEESPVSVAVITYEDIKTATGYRSQDYDLSIKINVLYL